MVHSMIHSLHPGLSREFNHSTILLLKKYILIFFKNLPKCDQDPLTITTVYYYRPKELNIKLTYPLIFHSHC